jgi:hypothetical protein
MIKELGINVPSKVRQTDHWRNRARYHSLLDKWDHEGEYVTFEKNVNYLIDFRMPKRMHQHNPEAKFIVLMRNPVNRTISQYYHNRRKPNREKLSFREAITRENSRIESEKRRMKRDAEYSVHGYGTYGYVQQSKYIEQLEHWFDYFPQEQFLFLEFEQFFTSPEDEIQNVFEFLDLPKQNITVDRAFNTGDYQSDIDEELIRELKDEFRPYNERLSERIGQDFNWGY